MRMFGSNIGEFFLDSTTNESFEFEPSEAYYRSPNASSELPEEITIDLVANKKSSNDAPNILDLRSSKNKIIIASVPGIYHLTFEILPLLTSILDKTDHDVIFDIKISAELTNENIFENYLRNFIEYLNNIYDHRVTIINSQDYDAYLVNNYNYLNRNGIRTSISETNHCFKLLKKCLNIDDTIKPFRKVYLSRKIVDRTRLRTGEESGARFNTDQRLLDEDILERFLVKHGFEIICPENFKDMFEQSKYFSEVRTLVSLTSSGMANTIFMQKNTNILELVTPFFINYFVGIGQKMPVVEMLHSQYGPMAYVLDQNYARIPNYNLVSNEIIDRIIASKPISSFLEIEYSND